MVATFVGGRGKRDYKFGVANIPAADMDTDASGDVVVTFSPLRYVELETVKINFLGGFGAIIQPNSVSGNAITCRVHTTGAGNGLVFKAYASQSDFAAAGITAEGY